MDQYNQTTELIPIKTSQKSFYKKALVYETLERIYLRSYSTLVCYIDKQTKTLVLTGYYSKTTAKHIREFAQQYGFAIPTKKQLDNNEILKK